MILSQNCWKVIVEEFQWKLLLVARVKCHWYYQEHLFRHLFTLCHRAEQNIFLGASNVFNARVLALHSICFTFKNWPPGVLLHPLHLPVHHSFMCVYGLYCCSLFSIQSSTILRPLQKYDSGALPGSKYFFLHSSHKNAQQSRSDLVVSLVQLSLDKSLKFWLKICSHMSIKGKNCV